MTKEMRPCWMDCAPSVGPTTSSWTIRAGAKHTSRLQRVGQVLGILDGEVARDRRLAAVNLAIDARSGIDYAVEHDGYGLAEVGLGDGRPFARTLGIHGHAHLRLAILVKLVLGVGDDVTLQDGAAVARGDLQGVELEDVLLVESVGKLWRSRAVSGRWAAPAWPGGYR